MFDATKHEKIRSFDRLMLLLHPTMLNVTDGRWFTAGELKRYIDRISCAN